MKNHTKLLMWFLMLSKRLLYKRSFTVLLIVIIAIVPAFSYVADRNTGIVNIALYSSGDRISSRIVSDLTDEKSIINYMVFEDEADASNAVTNGKCDAAWIFDMNFADRFEKYIAGKSIKPFVKIIRREENIFLMLASEKLYGKLYSHISYGVYEDFVRNNVIPDIEITDEKLKEFYDNEIRDDELILIKSLDGDIADSSKDINYLKAPLRGLLSLIVMLCGFAAALGFMKERENGVYSWLPSQKHIIAASGSCLAAILPASVCMTVAVYLSGTATELGNEITATVSFALAASGLCTLLCLMFKKVSVLGSAIPFLVIAMLVLCPLFFNLPILPGLRLCMPPYYYLMAIQNAEYIAYMLIYSLVSFLLAWSVGRIKSYIV